MAVSVEEAPEHTTVGVAVVLTLGTDFIEIVLVAVLVQPVVVEVPVTV